MHITFYVHNIEPETIERNEFYRQDVEILRSLGAEVVIATRLRDLPRHTDLLVVWWWNWLWLVGPIARRRRWPVCVTGVFNEHTFVLRPFYEQWLVRFGVRYGDWNIFLSQHSMLHTTKSAHFKNASYCPLIVPNDYKLRSSANDGRNSEMIFNVAWKNLPNMKRKMLPELVDAFALVRKTRPSARLVLAGDPLDGQVVLEEQVRRLSLGPYVKFLGVISRAEKIQRMQECGVYVQCSRYEGFGLATGEAMACGAPVVVNRTSAVPEVVGDCGYYVASETPEGIAEGILAAMANPAQSMALGLRGAERIEEFFRLRRRRDHFARILAEAGERASNQRPLRRDAMAARSGDTA